MSSYTDKWIQKDKLNHAGVSNQYTGNTDKMEKIFMNRVEPGNRDSNAGIQYYTPKSGVNRKTMIQPIIAPRMLDQDVWGKSATVKSNINKQTMRDITYTSLDTNDMIQQNQTVSSLGVPQLYQPRTLQDPNFPRNSLVPQNYVGENPDHGYYNAGETMYTNSMNRLDFNDQILPIYKGDADKKENNFPAPSVKMYYETPDEDSGLSNQYANNVINKSTQNPHEVPKEAFQNRLHYMKRVYGDQYGSQPANTKRQPQPQREHFASVDDPSSSQDPVAMGQGVLRSSNALENEFRTKGANIVPRDQYYGVMNRVPPGRDVQVTPVTDQLLEESPTYVFTDKYFQQPDAKLFLQDVQPKLYSYAVDASPINANIGVSYAPQNPPRVLDQIADANMAYPLISRVDPQLVRKDGTPGMRAKNPVRTNWSAEYSDFQAPEGSINFEDIYDPRFNSYGDPYRSYTDINLGQVQYYYSDIDAYRRPNFITRTNVDFVDFRDPNGKIKPYYPRTASLDEVRSQVENQTMADELLHRQDHMSSIMAKRNSEMVQLRQAPLRRTANSSMSYGPT